jgi:cation transport regulator
MPYRTNSQLPKKQTDQYSGTGKTAFRKAFNSALQEYHGDESSAFAVAHHAAQQTEAAKGHPKKR